MVFERLRLSRYIARGGPPALAIMVAQPDALPAKKPIRHDGTPMPLRTPPAKYNRLNTRLVSAITKPTHPADSTETSKAPPPTPTTIDGIRITRSGLDHVWTDQYLSENRSITTSNGASSAPASKGGITSDRSGIPITAKPPPNAPFIKAIRKDTAHITRQSVRLSVMSYDLGLRSWAFNQSSSGRVRSLDRYET